MTVQEIESAIAQLPASELTELFTWLESFRAQDWDKQIEADLESGRLDALLDKVEKEYAAGLAKPL